MLIRISIEEPVLPDWIYENNTDEALLRYWFNRAQTRDDIRAIEYLPCHSPWKAKYRSVNCSGEEYPLA